MASSSSPSTALSIRACAKINLTLHLTSRRPDGYHDLRTVLQAVALHDTLTFRARRGSFAIECDDPACPADRTNLVWRAAADVWRAAGRRGALRDVVVRLEKRIPMEAGLGGGSSDAAAAIRALNHLWRSNLSDQQLLAIAARLGADVPFFLDGGTALGVDRGDRLYPLADVPITWVTLVIPPFGVSTRDAYGWWDDSEAAAGGSSGKALEPRQKGARTGTQPTDGTIRLLGLKVPGGEGGNALEGPVAARHPAIARMVRALRRQGAMYAAMSGSGAAVFGLFESKGAADRAARALATRGRRALVTRTVTRRQYLRVSAPR